MEEECYENAEIRKINTVKELFDNFATRSMAYDFHHVIGLVKFDSMVKTLHTFTENLENFKVHIRNLEASGCTLLYDALRRGVSELEKVKTRFPDCRLRIICLTDGNDSGSSIEPAAVTGKLLKSDIIVDSILLGKVENNMLHGISNATGGCCFKPQTTKDGVKLFEIETVLSLEQRKPKNKLDPSSISESTLTGMFATHGYDEYPETSLPSQINSKVTMTEREMWWVLWVLAVLLALFCCLDVWYFLRAAVVILRAWFQPPVWDITAEQILSGRVTSHDIDMCHMNNARYLRECDFARFSLYTRNGVFKALRALGASMVVGATTIRYRRALCIGEGYELRSRIVTWDDKAFFLEQRFVSTKDGLVCAVMYCKQSVIRSSPDKIMQHLCKRKVECPEFPEDLQHWVNFISASSQALRAESGLEEKNK
uniref:Protein THEM6 n=2 Tax=Amphiprion ocellaris TaxID=80972 RepID=A0A3Q1BG10_AMPOC